jgi:tRNA-specific 2-thiouridylase
MDIIDSALKAFRSEITPGVVAVGMSGGVDSSVSAALLKMLGYEVVGLFMKNWDDKTDSACTAQVDANDVASVAKILNIPFYTVSFTKEYWDEVFESFLSDLKKGLTPNPDILCNREVKFKHLLEKALSLGSQAIATGHYAKIGKQHSLFTLEKAADASKDQSYFLYTASQYTLAHSIFPLAGLQKSHVREIARALKLPVSEKKDSTGICFIGERKLKDFLAPYLGYTPGQIVSNEGRVLGEHIGLAYYTIGQRKGLAIGGEGEAWFVVAKEVDSNQLIVAQGKQHASLFSHSLLATGVHWISGALPTFPLRCTAKIRYRQDDQWCTVLEDSPGVIRVDFDAPQRAVTPQQSVVLYDGEICLGGGFIKNGLKTQT